MRAHLMLFAGLILAVAVSTARPLRAEVTLDLHALDGNAKPGATTPPSAPTRPTTPPRRPAPPSAARKTQEPKQTKAAVPPAQPPAPAPPLPALAPAPPPSVSLAPIVVQPSAGKADAAPVPPVSADAGGGLEPIAGGIRVLFGASRADLAPASEAGIRSFVETVPKGGTVSFNVSAYAAGPPEDPSTPRRLSLSRALAVRSAMMAGGIPSAQIYLRALGANDGSGPIDRVDVTALGTSGAGAGK